VDLGSFLTILLMAAVLACQPWSVVAGIILVASDRGVPKEIAFVVGWMLALSVVAVASVLLHPDAQQSSTTSTVLAWVELGLGVVAFVWLVLKLRGRGELAATPAQGTPKWMARVDTMGPFPAALLGAFLPSYVVVLAAVSEMLRSGQSGTSLAVTAAVFVVVASLGVAAPLFVLVARRDQAPAIYAQWRSWLEQNVRLVVLVIGLVVAVMLITRGIAALA
jgi:hypothetical protein